MAEIGDAKASHVHAVITGRVQGVGFRYFVMKEATDLGLVGYVRNSRAHNELEVVAEGRHDQLERLLGAARRGPPGARVDDLRSTWTDLSGHYDVFRIDAT